jgi:imidazolonepropionase-like amidohydrolase
MRRFRLSGEDGPEEVKAGLRWIAVLLCIVARSHGEQPTLMIEDARVIVGDGAVRDAVTVVITAECIASVSAENPQLEGAKKVDARGMTLMPGLIDTHIHFFGLTARGEAGFRAQIETLAPKYMKDFLQHGVTTVKSLADPLDLVLELRDMVRDGKILGPRILVVGPCFTAPGGHPAVTLGQDDSWMRSEIAVEVDDEDAARREVRRLAEKGVDAIKAALEAGQGAGIPNTMPRLSTNVLRATKHTSTDCR